MLTAFEEYSNRMCIIIWLNFIYNKEKNQLLQSRMISGDIYCITYSVIFTGFHLSSLISSLSKLSYSKYHLRNIFILSDNREDLNFCKSDNNNNMHNKNNDENL